MSNIYEIIGKLLAAFVVALLAYLTPKVKDWLEVHTSTSETECIRRVVTAFCRAAEQLYHDADPNGEKRKSFVMEQLGRIGIEITEAVMNMIEGAVWEINTENKKAQVHAKALTAGEVDAIVTTQQERALVQTLAHQDADGNWVLNDPPQVETDGETGEAAD